MSSLWCEIGLSSLEDLGAGSFAPPPATDLQRECWGGERVTVMGEPNSGVTTVCRKLSGLSSNVGTIDDATLPFGPLSMKMTFVPPAFEGQSSSVFLEVCGLGRYHMPRDNLQRRLDLFTDWKFVLSTKLEQAEDYFKPADEERLKRLAVKHLQDMDDAFAIRLATLLSSTIVIVRRGDNIEELDREVDEFVTHYDAIVQIEEAYVGPKYDYTVRQTEQMYILYNFAECSYDAGKQVFQQFMDSRGLRTRHRVLDGHKRGFQLYSETGTLADHRRLPVLYAALFSEFTVEGREHNAALLGFVKKQLPHPRCDVVPLNSPFSPIEKSASFLLPCYLRQSRPDVNVSSARNGGTPSYRLSVSGRLRYRPDVFFIRNLLPDDEGTGLHLLLQTASHSTKTEDRREKITERRVLPEASNVMAKRVSVLSSGTATYFTIQASYKDPKSHEVRLFNDVVILPGHFKLVETIRNSAEVMFLFEKEQPAEVTELLSD